MSKYFLQDAEIEFIKDPKANPIPPLKNIDELKIGDIVYICFCYDDVSKELMWVRITGRDKSRFKGVLANNPIVGKGLLKHLDVIEFNTCHIRKIRDK